MNFIIFIFLVNLNKGIFMILNWSLFLLINIINLFRFIIKFFKNIIAFKSENFILIIIFNYLVLILILN